MPAESIRSTTSSSRDPALIHPFLDEIAKDKRKSTIFSGPAIDTGAAALHLAIRCATVPTVALLLSHRAISPNGIHPPGSGTTPLHLAASLGRLDIVQMLLEQEGIDDTLRDAEGRSVKAVAKGKDIVKAIQDSHAFLNASFRSLLRSYILSPPAAPPPPALIDLLGSPRTRFVNLSYLDDTSGVSLLHEAARRRDLRLIELAVRAGADVFVRDRRGRLPGEGLGAAKDEQIRVFLKQFANHDSTLLGEAETSTRESDPPTMKGYLNKYTNVAKGYNTRWFVLKNGILSYYRHQSDETIASRGSISLKSAILRLPPPSTTTTSSHLSTPSLTRSNSTASSTTNDRMRIEVHAHGQKWYMKANHPVEAARWAAALRKSAEWARREEGEASSASVNANRAASLRGVERERERRTSGESGESFGRSVRSKAGTLLRKARGGDGSAETSFVGGADATPDLGLGVKGDEQHEEEGENGYDEDDEDDEASITGSAGEESSRNPPHESVYELQGNTALAQMELTLQLVAALDTSAMSSSVSTSTTSLQTSSPASTTPSPAAALLSSLQTAHSLLAEHIQMSQERDTWFKAQAQTARRRQAVWAESLATVVREGEGLERELRTRSRRRGSRFLDTSEAPISVGQIPVASPIPIHPPITTPAAVTVDDEGELTDDEDKFFDAIESGTGSSTVLESTLPIEEDPSPPRYVLSKGLLTAITLLALARLVHQVRYVKRPPQIKQSSSDISRRDPTIYLHGLGDMQD
ncbi:hypothetical protein C0993_004660 [Termitomyces sp. T159_Od127]|nr:hypothetical protein C0993_004660 [Termitomyces sp. T159_Od127]